MESTELYQRILGLSGPWTVKDVDLDVAGRSVSIEVVHDAESACCPECGGACPRYDSVRRSWRHLDTCQMQTILSAEIPRANCPEHGIHQVRVPWAEPGSRFTALFEWVVVGWLKVAPISAVAELMGLTWDQVDGIRHRAVARGLARRTLEAPKRVGVDETSSKRGREYFTVMTDIDRSIVLHVAEGRKGESLVECLNQLTKEQVAGIEVVAMDMSGAYLAALREALPDAEATIAFDKFHVAQMLGEAVNIVRRGESKELASRQDHRLKKSRHLWLTNPDNYARWTPERRERFEALRSSSLRTARAWALKEAAMEMWLVDDEAERDAHWRWWHRWARLSRLEPMRKAAATLKAHLFGVHNAIRGRITNAISESMNSKIQWIKRKACGFRNLDRFRDAIYFHLGGLDMRPASLTHSIA